MGITLQSKQVDGGCLLILSKGVWFKVIVDNLGILCGQDDEIAATVHDYVLASIPDLLLQSFLHPIRIFLRSQSITLPLTYAAAAAALLHLPLNCALVFYLCLGIRGVAFASVCTNLNLLLLLVLYIYFSGVHRQTATLDFSIDCFKGWRSLLNLAILSAISVCLEWWWYEIMVLLCGFLLDPKSTVASMGQGSGEPSGAENGREGGEVTDVEGTPRHISVEAVLQVVLLLVQGAGCDQLEFSLLHRVKVVWGNRGGATGGFTALVDVPSGSTSATATVASAIREGPLLLSHQLISCGEDMAEATMTGGD
ncbi:protein DETOXIFICATION 48-like [Zingiber officinale]|uniref:protein DETOXIFICATION 48-like n=1 Tax=Zingiber officinale TaxID=94328 RepID=UPI001C4AE8B0|nr:protein DETOXIFICATION 48-like [Zingiber officinale]